MIYAGAKNIEGMKNAKIGLVSAVGMMEQKPHDLMGKY
jgi:hypothetical protein